MFDIGWAELMVIGSLALIVVGPRDLPKLLRSLGQYVAQARGMAREFQRSMEDAAREADISQLKGVRDVANDLRSLNKRPFETIKPSPNVKPAATPATAPAPVAEPNPVTAPSPVASAQAAAPAARASDDPA
ncbi:MAG: twin-arginine translocase subunit TatB [Alphaproteobacteria bacterium HGW-Alphaproteobacteria-8]|jgi:sec-independent protein translocase protein TatB|nr:MAG: twin-arginine translocase subunit TatB [Alphaproteobacteria bacterium HGW-Alphaproteobacteria-8]